MCIQKKNAVFTKKSDSWWKNIYSFTRTLFVGRLQNQVRFADLSRFNMCVCFRSERKLLATMMAKATIHTNNRDDPIKKMFLFTEHLVTRLSLGITSIPSSYLGHASCSSATRGTAIARQGSIKPRGHREKVLSFESARRLYSIHVIDMIDQASFSTCSFSRKRSKRVLSKAGCCHISWFWYDVE